MNFTRLSNLSVSESVTLMCDASACGWLAGDTDGLAGDWWAGSKWACTGAARRLTLHGGRGQQAGTAAASTGGVLVLISSIKKMCTILHRYTGNQVSGVL